MQRPKRSRWLEFCWAVFDPTRHAADAVFRRRGATKLRATVSGRPTCWPTIALASGNYRPAHFVAGRPIFLVISRPHHAHATKEATTYATYHSPRLRAA